MIGNGIQSYRKTKVVTADPGKLVLMCYQGAIDQLKIAAKRYKDEDYEEKYMAVEKAQDIIEELLCSLDFERGGAIARNLESLYHYVSRRIVQADTGKDLRAFDEVIGILEELKSAWEIVFKKQNENRQLRSIRAPGGNPQLAPGRMSA